MSEHERTKDEGEESGLDGYVRFIDWLNEKLFPILGTPALGPYDPIVTKVGDAMGMHKPSTES